MVILKTNNVIGIFTYNKLQLKGPFIVIEVKSPVLYKIVDRKGWESVINHDRMKLCKDSDHPGWIKRKINRILENPEITSRRNPENEISDIDDI